MHENCKIEFVLLQSLSTKFVVLDAKVQNSAVGNIYNFGPCCNLIVLSINFKSKWVFWITKVYNKYKLKGPESS